MRRRHGGGGATTPLGEPPQALTIDGSLAFRERIALPLDSTAIVAPREASSADGRVVAESRVPLEGRQVPIPFTLLVDRARLAAGARDQFSGAIVSGGRPIRVTEPVEIDAALRAIELGGLRLARYPALASATTLHCGDQAVTVGHVGDTLRLTIGSEAFNLRRVAAASGARHEANVDPSTSFWSKGERATLVVRGQRYPDRSRVTLNFGADSRVGGAASCNRYTAAYALTGEGLAISKAAATTMACAPSLMQQERLFLDLPGQVRRFTLDATGALVLHATDGRTVRARRVPG